MESGPEPWNSRRLAQVAREVFSDLESFEVLRQKKTRYVVRYPEAAGRTVVLKLWAAEGLRTRLSTLLRLSSVCHEWRCLRRAEALGVRVPAPLASTVLSLGGGRTGGAIALEDLGPCAPAIAYIQERIAAGDEERLGSFETGVLEMTGAMVHGNLLDDDHGILNMVVKAHEPPIRLDLERARSVISRRLHPRLLGHMLGRLLATYTFAVQPEVSRTVELARRLMEITRPTRRAWEHASAYVEERMQVQKEQKGYETVVPLPRWS